MRRWGAPSGLDGCGAELGVAVEARPALRVKHQVREQHRQQALAIQHLHSEAEALLVYDCLVVKGAVCLDIRKTKDTLLLHPSYGANGSLSHLILDEGRVDLHAAQPPCRAEGPVEAAIIRIAAHQAEGYSIGL